MGKNANFVSHKKSKLKNQDGSPQLPSSSALVEGEIAINFGKDVETLSIKNESGDVVTFSSDNYYSEKKLGSAFTGANSAVTVTDVIEENEEIIAAALNDLETRKLDTTAYTPTEELWVSGTGLNSVVLKGSSGTASGDYSVAEGKQVSATTYQAHAEGNGTLASGVQSHAEGYNTRASGDQSHAEGQATSATSYGSHAEGLSTLASESRAHAEGDSTSATAYASHAEGYKTLASASYSHAEGNGTRATGVFSHTEGNGTSGTSLGSHAEGFYTIANNVSEHASGQYNISSTASTTFGNSGNTLFSVGNGTADNARHNAFEIRQNGDIYVVSGGTNILLQDNIGKVEVISAITPSNSGSTAPIATKVVAENELTISNALNDLDARKLDASAYTPTDLSNYYTKSETSGATEISNALGGKVNSATFTSHTADTTVHFTTNDRLKWETLNRRTRKNFTASGSTYFINTLKSAIADQDLEKYGLKVGDYITINTYDYVIAGLNTMRGTSTPYRVGQDHVGLIVIPHAIHAWNTSNSTSQSQNTHSTDGTWTLGTAAAGYASCDLQYYLEDTVLPHVKDDLGSANILSHYKLYSNAVNTSGYNRFGSPGGCSSSWAWYANQEICALSEVQVYGSIVWSSSGFDTGEACRQLDVFRVYNMNEIFGGEYPWLRDVASASTACLVGLDGIANFNDAYYSYCVAALILFA